MLPAAKVVESLNKAVYLDWQAVQKLAETRALCSDTFALLHDTIICAEVHNQSGGRTGYAVGFLGMLNGMLADGEPPIEACFDDSELIGFRLRGGATPKDQRQWHPKSMLVGSRYRIKDAAGHIWEGRFFVEPPADPRQGIHLKLDDGSVSRIFFHDATSVIPIHRKE